LIYFKVYLSFSKKYYLGNLLSHSLSEICKKRRLLLGGNVVENEESFNDYIIGSF
jgi:hypothetical protein